MIHRRLKATQKRVPSMQTESGFRLIRVFSDEHNAARFKVHVQRLTKQLALQPGAQKFRLVVKRARRNKNAPYQAQQPGTGRGDGNHHAASIATS
jgi:hypothetical protein